MAFSSQKKPVTYGRRGKTGERTPTFEALSRKTPTKTLSRSNLPSPSASPLRSPFTTSRREKPDSEADVFDVPSSDESPRLKPPSGKRPTRPTSKRSTPDPLNARKANNQSSAKSEQSSSDVNTHSLTTDPSVHRELLGLALPDPHSVQLLLSDRPTKRQKTNSRAKPVRTKSLKPSGGQQLLLTRYKYSDQGASQSNQSSRSSSSVQSDDSQQTSRSEKLLLEPAADIWEVPSSDSEVGSQGHANEEIGNRRGRTRTVEQNSKARLSGIRNTRAPTANFQGSGDGTSQDFRPRTPDGVPTSTSTKLPSLNPDDDSPTPKNKQPVPSPQKGSSTPKQAKLWGRLLTNQSPSESPSGRFKLLNLDHVEKTKPTGNKRNEYTRRKRLIDGLIPSTKGESLEDDQLSEYLAVSENEKEDTYNDINIAKDDVSNTKSLEFSDLLQFDQPDSQPEYEKRAVINTQKRTYGGQRSYLEDSSEGLQNLLDQPLDIDDDSATHHLDLNLATSLLVASREKHDKTRNEDSDDDTGVVKTVYDLRAAGGMEHFTDEVNEIIDDLSTEKAAISRKRMALLDLHTKMLDPTFRTRFNQHGYGSVIFCRCSVETDAMIGAVGAAVLVQVIGPLEDSADSSQLHDAGCLSFLTRQLGELHDLVRLAKDRRSNMSKAAQASIESFTATLRQTFPWKEKALIKISPKALALVSIEVLVRRLREQGNTDPLLDAATLFELLNILDSSVPKIHEKNPDTESGSGVGEMETVLSILESCTTVAACTQDYSTWTESLLGKLCSHLERAMLIDEPSIRRLTPRLSLNLANGNEAHARVFSRGSFVKHLISRILVEFESLANAKVKDGSLDLDVLLLCLGAMLNLAEHSNEIRSTVTADGKEQLEALVSIFLRGRKQAEEADSLAAVEANVAYGWLAVLLGNLCQSEMIRTHVVKLLPSKGLKPVIDAVDEFVSHHKAADQTAQGNEAYEMFTKRLQGVADTLRALDQ